MKLLVATVDLFNRLTREFEDAQLYSGLDDKNLDDFESRWLPVLAKKLQRSTPKELLESNAQDARWNWRRKELAWGGVLSYQAFAVEADGLTQGLMYVNKDQFSRIASLMGAPLVYVEAIATAPWNRPKLTKHPKYKGAGMVLMQAAISLSFEEEYKGRVALHALPESESWYRDVLRMVDFGPDPDCQSLVYFELTAEQALALTGGKEKEK
jgi:hypothetical protein